MTDGNRPSCPAGGRASPTPRQKKLRLAPLGIYDNFTPRRVEVQRVSSVDTQTVCGSLPKRFTRAKRGQRCRDGYAASVGGLCEDCLAKGLYRPGEIVHHMTELTPDNINDPAVSLSWSNLRLLCRDCHAKRHGARKRYKVDAVGRVTPRW